MSNHKTITLEAFKRLNPCWIRQGREGDLNKIGARKTEWSALDILRLPNDEVSAEDRLWSARWLIEDKIMHEFACRCAEEALKLVKNPDPRSVAAIAAKRAWLLGEIDNEQLASARAAAWAAAWAAASDAAWASARAAAWGNQINILIELIEKENENKHEQV